MSRYIGIDYGSPISNRDIETGIHYGCISIHSLADWIYDELEPYYPPEIEINCNCGNTFGSTDNCDRCPECESNTSVSSAWDCLESNGCTFNPSDSSYAADYSESMNCLIITKSPYYTFAVFCSPCVPGAGDLDHPASDGCKCFCFGPEYFENEKAPYPIYSVETGNRLNTSPIAINS